MFNSKFMASICEQDCLDQLVLLSVIDSCYDSYLESYLLRHTFSLVSQNNRITITASLLACVLSQLKLLQSSTLKTI